MPPSRRPGPARLLLVPLALAACRPPPAPDDGVELLGLLGPPSTAAVRHRTHGNWQTVGPGEELVVLDAAGAGVVRRMWFTVVVDGTDRPLRELRLEARWDGAAEPAVCVPLGDLFGAGHGEPAEIQSALSSARGTGLGAWWPMPFAAGAKLRLVNDGTRVAHVYHQVDWDEVARPSPLRFQASWRRQVRTTPGLPMPVADIRGRGFLVGTVLAVDPLEPGWWGEGDDLYLVDPPAEAHDTPLPLSTPWTIRGTGTEDFVVQAWGLQAASGPWAGVADQPGRHVSLYRWMVLDPIPFRDGLVAAMEQQGRPVQERHDDVSATALWYQLPPLSPVPALPPAAERLSAPTLRGEVWRLPGPVVPVSLAGVANRSRTGVTPTWPGVAHPLIRPGGPATFAGVELVLPDGRGDTATALSLEPGQSASLALPEAPGADTLYVLLAANGERDRPALLLDAGGEPRELRFGTHLDPYGDVWPVPEGRIAWVNDLALTVRGGYVAAVPVPEAARTLRLTAAPGVSATIYAMARGPAPLR